MSVVKRWFTTSSISSVVHEGPADARAVFAAAQPA